MAVLYVPNFGGGVVLEGGAEQRSATDLITGDQIDLARTGAAMRSGTYDTYTSAYDEQGTPAQLNPVLGMGTGYWLGRQWGVVFGHGSTATPTATYYANRFDPTEEGATSIPAGQRHPATLVAGGNPAQLAAGVLVTVAGFPYVDGPGFFQDNPMLVCLGAREGTDPDDAPGLFYFGYVSKIGGTWQFEDITGQEASLGDGTSAKRLYFRGIATYNERERRR
jgi:hypothetical protein